MVGYAGKQPGWRFCRPDIQLPVNLEGIGADYFHTQIQPLGEQIFYQPGLTYASGSENDKYLRPLSSS